MRSRPGWGSVGQVGDSPAREGCGSAQTGPAVSNIIGLFICLILGYLLSKLVTGPAVLNNIQLIYFYYFVLLRPAILNNITFYLVVLYAAICYPNWFINITTLFRTSVNNEVMKSYMVVTAK